MKYEINPGFQNIIGYDMVIKELKLILKLISRVKANPQQPLPSGIMIYGQSGMGKTLLLRTIKKEAQVSVFTLFASNMQFDDEEAMIDSVKNTFENALAHEPSLILIDDLDWLLNGIYGNDLTNTIKSKLLDLWDNKMLSHQVLPIATTSNHDISELLERTGRFEQHLVLPKHGPNNRIELMDHIINQLNFQVNPSLTKVNHIYMNASPGDIRHQLILAMQIALKNTNQPIIRKKDLLEARERAKSGLRTPETRVLSSELWRTSVHEAGHTLATYATLYKDTFVQVSIVPTEYSRGHSSFGIEGMIEEVDTEMSYNSLIMRFLSGAYAEKNILGEHSTGCLDDIRKATTIATQMVYEYGMGELGLRNFTGEMDNGEYIPISSDMKLKADKNINKNINNLESVTNELIQNNERLLVVIAKELYNRKILFKEDIDEFVQDYGIIKPSF